MSQAADFTGKERRRFARVPFPYPVHFQKCRLQDGGVARKDRESSAEAKDISMGGLCLSLPEKINSGEILSLKIFLPFREETDASILSVLGEVRWVQTSEKAKGAFLTGIEFRDLSRFDRLYLESFIMEQLQGKKSPYT